jgi:hypothetical protein
VNRDHLIAQRRFNETTIFNSKTLEKEKAMSLARRT